MCVHSCSHTNLILTSAPSFMSYLTMLIRKSKMSRMKMNLMNLSWKKMRKTRTSPVPISFQSPTPQIKIMVNTSFQSHFVLTHFALLSGRTRIPSLVMVQYSGLSPCLIIVRFVFLLLLLLYLNLNYNQRFEIMISAILDLHQ